MSYKPTYVYFPHGIINPNYPGFQHLAHTLSENFVDNNNWSSSYSSFEEYDSDITDYEMDFSKDSFESLNEEKGELQKVNSLDNFNLTNDMNKNINDNLLAAEDENLEKNGNNNSCVDKINSLKNEEQNQFKNKNILKKDATMLDENQTSVGREQSQIAFITQIRDDKYSNDISCITPDILIENNHKYYSEKKFEKQIESKLILENSNLNKKDGRPDLLCGVSPPYTQSTEVIRSFIHQCPIECIPNAIVDLNVGKKSLNCDEINSLGNTPVDIIGDFGQEVEREFDLLVTGYKRINGEKENLGKLQLMSKEEEYLSRKLIVTDAPFTYIGEQIDLNRYEKFSDHTIEDKNIGATTVNPLIINIDKYNSKKTFWNRNQNAKVSYDEKQLPPIAIEYKKYQPKRRLRLESLNSKKDGKPLGSSKSAHSQSVIKHNNSNGEGSKLLNTSTKLRRTAFKQERVQVCKHTENNELYQYRQLISDKEAILKNSRYAQCEPSWTQYLTRKDKTITENDKDNNNCKNNNNAELLATGLLGTIIDI